MSVTIVIGKRHLFGGLSLLVLTALIGIALVVPAVSDATVTTYTRSASCAGLDFYPTDSATGYDNDGAARIHTTGGSGAFRCDPGLPTGAHVTKVQFTLEWQGPGPTDFQCALRRSALTVQGVDSAETIASVPGLPGWDGSALGYRVSTSAISNGTIDNANYGYWFECVLPASDGVGYLIGISGADVIYTITAAKG
jgi:hypothetical protein